MWYMDGHLRLVVFGNSCYLWGCFYDVIDVLAYGLIEATSVSTSLQIIRYILHGKTRSSANWYIYELTDARVGQLNTAYLASWRFVRSKWTRLIQARTLPVIVVVTSTHTHLNSFIILDLNLHFMRRRRSIIIMSNENSRHRFPRQSFYLRLCIWNNKR